MLAFRYPIIAKETGSGISRNTAKALRHIGVKGIDVGGVSGTSFSAVEVYRAKNINDDLRERLGRTFWDWGVPTPVSVVSANVGLDIIATGGIRNGMDVAKSIALGADGCVIGTADLVAVECVRCGNCESGRGCARGIASTDPELGCMISEEYVEQRLINMYMAWRKQWCDILRGFGMKSIKELTGRSDLLVHLDYLEKEQRDKYQPAPEYKMVL
ncbi:MAG: alpha-hydroxy-acid oxidizing protein [Actinomycetia bacterium]|nr:alpha-hydroxy-acid oxidizing protein [Actinomycetes bacterium]